MTTEKAIVKKPYVGMNETVRTMKGRLYALCLAAAMALCGVVLGAETAGTSFYWVGGSGTWSDVSNWSTDSAGTIQATRYPGSETSVSNDVAIFTASANGTITVDKDLVLYRFVGNSPASEGENPLTFTGGETVHSIKVTTTSNSYQQRARFMEGRNVTFINISYIGKYLEFRGDAHIGSGTTMKTAMVLWNSKAHVYFEEGCTTLSGSSCSMLQNGAKITFNGGNLDGTYGSGTGSSDATYGGTMTFNGGSYSLSLTLKHNMVLNVRDTELTLTGVSFDGTENVNVSNSRIIWNAPGAVSNRGWLGDADTVFEKISDNSYTTVRVTSEAEPILEVSGTVIVTNNNSTTYQAFAVTNSGAVYGSGTMYLSRLRNENKSFVSFGVDRLYLKKGLSFNTGGYFYFNDQYFGSFGDWSVSTSSSYGYNYLGGTSVFDTTDCFDGTTGHTITMWRSVPEIGSSLTVQGCGRLVWLPLDTPSMLNELKVESGATFTPSNGTVCAEKVTLGANATLDILAGDSAVQLGSFEAAKGAAINVRVPANRAKYAYPVATAVGDCDIAEIQSRVVLSGEGAANYSTRSDMGCIYMRSGNAYEVPSTYQEANFWTGAVDGYTGTAGNWYTNGVPISSGDNTKVYFGGYDHLTITNNLTKIWKSWIFTADCGPAVVRGDTVMSYSNATLDNSGSSFIALSPFPVVFEAPVRNRGYRISANAAGGSYIEFASNVYSQTEWNFFVMGHVRVSGSVDYPKGLFFGNAGTGARMTTLEVMPGGSVCVTSHYEYVSGSTVYHQLYDKLARFVVHEGGKVEFRSCINPATGLEKAKFGWTGNGTRIRNLVDGEFDIQCPLVGKTPMWFGGTGTLHVASTQTTNANATLVLGGGLRFTSDGFRTVTAEGVTNAITIEVEGTGATFAADRDWIYGPEPGVETTTTAEDRALFIRNGATLRFAAGAHKVMFADPIAGYGKMAFDPGAQIGLAGELFESCKTAWTPFATVLEVEGYPAVAGCAVRAVPLGNGLTELQAKLQVGMRIILR